MGSTKKINVKMAINTEFTNAKNAISKLQKDLDSIKLPKQTSAKLTPVIKEFENYEKLLNRIQNFSLTNKNAGTFKNLVGDLQKNLDKVKDKIKDIEDSFSGAKNTLEERQNYLIEQLKLKSKSGIFDPKLTAKQAMKEGTSSDDLKDYSNLKRELTIITKQLMVLDSQEEVVKKLIAAFKMLEPTIKAGDKASEELNAEMSQLSAEQASDKIKELATRFLGFTAIVQIGRTAVNQFKTTMVQLDESLTAIAAVTGKTRAQMWEMVGTYNEMAFELGTTTQQIAQASKLYYQQGRTQSEVTELVKQTAILATTAEIDYATATNYLTAAINGYNVSAEEAYKVTDSWSALAAASAVDVKELATAMSKVASLAAASGMAIETTSAFLSKMLETTREASENLGTALKTIISRFQDLKMSDEELEDGVDANAVEKALASVGVALRDTTGQFRDFDDVLLDLSKIWDTLSVNSQKYIATIAAGSRQQSRFIALVSDYERNLELIEISQDSAGSSAAQFNVFLTGLQASFNRLTSAWEGFYTSFEQGPSIFSAMIDFAANLLNILTEFGPVTTSLVGVLNALIFASIAQSAATKIGKISLKEVTLATFASSVADTTKTMTLKTLTAAMWSSIKAIVAQTGKFIAQAATVALTVAPYLALAAAVAGLTAGIIYLATSEKRHIDTLKKESQQLKATSTEAQQSSKSIQSLKEEYITAAKAGEDLTTIQQKLQDSFPDLAKEIDLTTVSLKQGITALNEYSLKAANAAAANAFAAIDADRALFEAENKPRRINDYGYKINGQSYSTKEEAKQAYIKSHGSDSGFNYYITRTQFIENFSAEMPDGTVLGPFTSNDEYQQAIDNYYNENFIPDSMEVAKIVSRFALEAEINDEPLYEAEKVAIEQFVKESENNSDYIKKIENEDGTITYELTELGVEKSNEAAKQARKYTDDLIKIYQNAGVDLEEATEKANDVISRFLNGEGFFTPEEYSYLTKLFPDGSEELKELETNIEKAQNDIYNQLSALYGSDIPKDIFELMVQILQNSGTVGGQAFLDALETKIKEGTDQNFANEIAELPQGYLTNGEFTIDQNSILEASGDTMQSFKLLSKIIQNFGAESQAVKPYVDALLQSIKKLEIDSASMGEPFDNMISSWEKLKAAGTEGLDTESYIQMLTEYSDILSEQDFIVDETTGNKILLYESMMKLAEAQRAEALETARANLQAMEAVAKQNETKIAAYEAAASRYELAAATREAELADAGLSAEEDSVYNRYMQKAAFAKEEAEKLRAETKLNLDIAEQEVKNLESGTLAQTYFAEGTDKATEALEKQKEALEASKEALEKQKEALEDARDAAKDYAEMLADAIKNRLEDELEKATSAVENYYDALNQALEELIDNATDELDKLQQAAEDAQNLAEENADALQEQADLVIDFYDKQIEAIQAKIDASQEEADALERLQKLQEARDAYEQAKQKTRLVLIEGAGWRFRTDKDALTEAGESLATTETENQNELLEQQIEALENIKAKWEEIAENIGKATSELEKTANFQAFLESRSPDQLDDLYNQFVGSVGQNNALFENALQAQNKYEEQNNADAEGTLAWQISQWQQAQEQAELDQKQFDILTDPNAKAVEELKQQLLQQLGSASGESIQNVLSNGLQITIENAEKVNSINDTLDALEELLNKMDMTSEEIAKYNDIQNMVGQASLEALLEGGSVYSQLENEINQIIYLNDQIDALNRMIDAISGQIDSLDSSINGTTTAVQTEAAQTRGNDDKNTGIITESFSNINFPVYGPFSQFNPPHAAVGGVQDEGDYLRVHGTKNRPELVLNNSQAAGLFKFIDSLTRMPSILASLPSLAKNESSQTINNEEGLSFQNCVFEIKTDSDNLEGLISDLKRQVPFK